MESLLDSPWKASGTRVRGGIDIDDARGRHIATAYGGVELQQKANLIAAAPDLYKALHALVNSPNAKQNAMWDHARAALAKVSP